MKQSLIQEITDVSRDSVGTSSIAVNSVCSLSIELCYFQNQNKKFVYRESSSVD